MMSIFLSLCSAIRPFRDGLLQVRVKQCKKRKSKMPSLSVWQKKAHRTLHTIYIRQRITEIKTSVQRKQWQRNRSIVPSLSQCVCVCVCISRIRVIFRNSDTYILWVAERYWNHCMWFPLFPYTFSLPHTFCTRCRAASSTSHFSVLRCMALCLRCQKIRKGRSIRKKLVCTGKMTKC